MADGKGVGKISRRDGCIPGRRVFEEWEITRVGGSDRHFPDKR